MTLIVVVASIFCAFFAGLILLVCRKLVADPSLPNENDWLVHLSPHRYRPLERLLDGDEYRRLGAHPAITRKMLRRIRARRVRLFRDYLQCLSLDYNRVCKMIKLLMVQSAHDRPDLAGLLVRHRATFVIQLTVVELRLTLHSLGLGGVEVAELVAALDHRRLELYSLLESVPYTAAA